MNVLPQKYQERLEARKRGRGSPAQTTLRGFTIIPPPDPLPQLSLQNSSKGSSNIVASSHKNPSSASTQLSQQYLSPAISRHEPSTITPKTTRSAAREAGYTPTFQIKWGRNSTSVIMSARPTPSPSLSSSAHSKATTPVLNVLQPTVAKSQPTIPPQEKSARKRIIVEDTDGDDEKDSSWYRKRSKVANGAARPIETKKSNNAAASTKDPVTVQPKINERHQSAVTEDLNENDKDKDENEKEKDEDENEEDKDENEISTDEDEERNEYNTDERHLQSPKLSDLSELKSQTSSSSKTTGEQSQKRTKGPRTTFKVNKITSNGKRKLGLQKASISEVDVVDEVITGVIADALETNANPVLKERIKLFGKEVEIRFIEQADVYDEHFLLQSAVIKAKRRKKSIRQQLLLAHREREDITTKLTAVQKKLDIVDTEYGKMEQMHSFLTQLDKLKKTACNEGNMDVGNTKSLPYTAKLGTANLVTTIAARCGSSISGESGALAAVRRLNSFLESCEAVIHKEVIEQ